MSFESGSVGVRWLQMPRSLPDDAVERFRRRACPPIETIGAGEVRGWVTGRHLLDRDIREETALVAGHLRLALLQVERRIPASLLRAQCRMEELAEQAAMGRDFLRAKDRKRIREDVTERLLPTMPPQIRATDMVLPREGQTVYAGALSVAQCDVFMASFLQAMEFSLTPLTPDALAMLVRRVDVTRWRPCSFSPEVGDDVMEPAPGREFLTWLWHVGETRGGRLFVKEGGVGEVTVAVEGPLLLAHEGQGAHESLLRRGAPEASVEAQTCLLGGKKLKRATVALAMGEQTYRFALDADEFVLRGLRLPESGDERAMGEMRLDGRVLAMERLREAFFGVYGVFLDERRDAGRWKETRDALHTWVQTRVAKR